MSFASIFGWDVGGVQVPSKYSIVPSSSTIQSESERDPAGDEEDPPLPLLPLNDCVSDESDVAAVDNSVPLLVTAIVMLN